jgi:hypothetical protein
MVCLSNIVFDKTNVPGDSAYGLGHEVLKDMLPDVVPVALAGNPEEFDSAAISLDEDEKLGAMKSPILPGAGKDTIYEPVPPPNTVLTTACSDQARRTPIQVSSLSHKMNSSEVSSGLARKFTEVEGSVKHTAQASYDHANSSLVTMSLNTPSPHPPSKKLKRVQDRHTMLRRSLRRRKYTTTASAEVQVSDENNAEFALGDDQVTYAEAAAHPSWRQAMKKEYDSLMENQT